MNSLCSYRTERKILQREDLSVVIAVVLAITLAANAKSQEAAKPVPVVTGDPRVDKLLSQMTLEEKISMIHGAWEPNATNQGEAGYLAGIPRLGIPSLRLVDGPPGVLTRLPSQAETATMGLAATFSKEDAEQNGVVIGREAKSLGEDVVLEPFINIDRDVASSRGYNTFGEDPLLTGQIAAAQIRGTQSQGIMSQAKHYVANESGDNVFVGQQALHEIYVAPFKDAVDAGVSSIMCSHNKVNGTRSCGNPDTLDKILREELGFKGFVTSDWGATHAPTFVNNGLDLEMPGPAEPGGSPVAAMFPSFFNYEKPSNAPPPPPVDMAALVGGMMMTGLPEEPKMQGFGGMGPMDMGFNADKRINLWNALHDGSVKEEAITKSVGRILYEMNALGFLNKVHQHDILPHDTKANAKIIEKTGEDAAVLLKNEAGILPLQADSLSSLAMIGPTAGQVDAIGQSGERSVGFPERQVGPLEALKRTAAGAQAVNIQYAVEDDMTGTPIPAELFSHDGQPGLERTEESGATKIDATVDFTKTNSKAFAPNAKYSWKGTLTVPSAGSYWIYLQLLGAGGSVSIDGKPVVSAGLGGFGNLHGNTLQANQDNVLPTTDGLDNVRRAVELAVGAHSFEVTVAGDTSNDPEQIRVNWVTPEQRQANHETAIAAAKAAKTVVVSVWTRGRPDFGLPGDQDKLIEEVSAVNPNTIVVLNVSQPIAMPWLDKVKAVLEMWWPGDEGGWATANILLGKTSPAGRLPFTWARRREDYVASDPAHPERSSMGADGKTTYSEGIFVGYRWFDKQNIEPLFPFGFGLSYTKFAYSDLTVEKARDGGLDVSFEVKNSGSVAGDEVPQVYLGAPDRPVEGAEFAVRALGGFGRIHLAMGESSHVTLHVPLRSLQYWSTQESKWLMAPTARKVFVGGSSRDLPISKIIGG